MRKRTYKWVCLFLVMVLAFGCCTTLAYGKSKTVKMTVYTQCIKDGDKVYCNTGDGIYKVNLKKGKAKRIVKLKSPAFESYAGMKLKKGYLYLAYTELEGSVALERAKTSGKSHKVLADFYSSDEVQFAIDGKKLYYKGYSDYDFQKKFKKKMNLNGKNKKKTSNNVKTKYVKSNKKGYKVIQKVIDDSDNVEFYLKTPSKTIYLTTVDYSGE